MKEKKYLNHLEAFVATVAALRDPVSGCPWDLEQDHRSLRPYLLEETHEVLEAIDSGEDAALRDELGDLLLQVVLHAQIAAERQAFNLGEVIEAVNQKMIRRHPHVFGETEAHSAQQVLKNWEEIKKSENAEKNGQAAAASLPESGRLRGIPRALPALTRAQRIGEKAASCNFDWESVEGVLEKVQEELQELRQEIAQRQKAGDDESSRSALEHELGDSLFALAQLARWLGINAEDSLRSCCERFLGRFERLEASLAEPIRQYSLADLEAAWQAAKKSE